VATPAVTFDDAYLHNDLFQMAAAYAFHIAENQPFLDGNKRTALNAALVFLDINGWLVLDPDARLANKAFRFCSAMRHIDFRDLVVRVLARHSDLQTTQRSSDLDANELRAAIDRLDGNGMNREKCDGSNEH